MRLTHNKVLDILFFMFIFSTIVISNSIIGKFLQLLFVAGTMLFAYTKERKFTIYNFAELLFVLYVLFQTIANIAVLKSSTFKMSITLLYAMLFSLGMYNYLIYRKDVKKIAYIYAKATIVALFVIMILYFKTLLSFRLDASKMISIFGIKIFGGSSSTALSLMALIPAFFLTILPSENYKRKRLIYITILSFFSLLTGTRKTIILILFIFTIINLIKNKHQKLLFFKTTVKFVIVLILGYLLVMYVPFLYNMVGVRLQNAVVYYNTTETDDASIRVRNRMKESAIRLYKTRPVYGWGMDYFKASLQSSLGYYCHNNFLELLSGGGIVGFTIYYFKYLYLAIIIIKGIKRSPSEKIELLSCLGFLIIMTFLEYWQVTYFYRYTIIYQVILLYLANSIKKSDKIEEKGFIEDNEKKKIGI